MWAWLAGAIDVILSWLALLIDRATDGLIAALQGLGNWLSATLGGMFSSLTAYLSALLGPLLDLVGGLVYLLMSLIDVIVLVVQVLLLLVQVLFSVVSGVGRTFGAFLAVDLEALEPTYSPFAQGTEAVVAAFSQAGGDVLAQILTWGIWLVFAVALIRLVARERAG